MEHAFYSQLRRAAERGENCALGIITGVKGSSPQKAGAKALFFADGRICGTMGGGCLEAEIQQRAIRSLSSGMAESFELVLDHDFGWDDGLICGGKVQGVILPGIGARHLELWKRLGERKTETVWSVGRDYSISHSGEFAPDALYQEQVGPPALLWIAGAGHIAQALAPLAREVDFEVHIFDDRKGLANEARFPEGVALQVDYWEELLRKPLPERTAFGVIMTQGHQHDSLVLKEWIGKGFDFLGMIGSSRKWRMIREGFLQEGCATEEQLAKVQCPVGIAIGSVTPKEIAVSIAAQLIQSRKELRG